MLCPYQDKKLCQEQLEADALRLIVSSPKPKDIHLQTERDMLSVHQPFCLEQGKHESKNHLLPKFYRFISPLAPHLANQDC